MVEFERVAKSLDHFSIFNFKAHEVLEKITEKKKKGFVDLMIPATISLFSSFQCPMQLLKIAFDWIRTADI